MSRSFFSLLSIVVTIGGLFGVIGAVHLVHQLTEPFQRKALAGFLCVIYMSVVLFRPSYWLVIDLAVFAGAIGGVLLIQSGLQTPGSVVVFLSIAAGIDLFSMSGGISHILVESYRTGKSDLLVYLTLVAPIHGRAIPVVGIGDLLVGGAAATALLRFGIWRFAVLGTMAGALLIALAYALWRGATPALPFIAVAVSILVWRSSAKSKKRSRSDAERADIPCRNN